MMTFIVVLCAALLVAYFGWRWWQGQVSKAAGKSLGHAAQVAAALALSDMHGGGQLLWEAGQPRYLPAADSSGQHKALLRAWEMALAQQLERQRSGKPPAPAALPQQLDSLMPEMLPAANLGLYTPQPRSRQQAQRNLTALAATSMLMERRAHRWLLTHQPLIDELSGQLQQQSTLEAVRLESWRNKVEERISSNRPF